MGRPKYLLLGWPVKHSLSPPMQKAAFEACGIEADYEVKPVEPQSLQQEVARLRDEPEIAGWNVTLPHKHAMVGLVDELGPDAAAAESVNTVVKQDGKLQGYSTDGYGLEKALEEAFGLDVGASRLVFLGTGGAAKATSVFLARQGVPAIGLINRTAEKARVLAEIVQRLASGCEVQWCPLDDEEGLRRLLTKADILVQSTSLGLKDEDPLPLSPELVEKDTAVYEMIYRATPFLSAVQARGCAVEKGFGMLLHQGARSFSLWTGQPAPVEEMRRALFQAAG